MTDAPYPRLTRALAQRRSAMALRIHTAFQQFSQAVFQDGALPRKSWHLIADAVAHVPSGRIVSRATPRWPPGRARRPKRSWKRSG